MNDLCELSTGWIKEHGHKRAEESITSGMLFLDPLLRYVNFLHIFVSLPQTKYKFLETFFFWFLL